eukprot:15343336-Ditylum_brightwellii.AAC.1
MGQQPSNPDFNVLLTALGPEPSAPLRESSSSDGFLNAKSVLSLASCNGVGVDLFGAGGSPSTTFSNTRDMEEVDLSFTHNGVDIMYFPSSNFLCLGCIGAVQTKFCTCLTCSISSHQTKHEHFWASLYLKAGQNAVYCTQMLPADCIPGKQVTLWLEENDTSMGIWRERFTLSNTIHMGMP